MSDLKVMGERIYEALEEAAKGQRAELHIDEIYDLLMDWIADNHPVIYYGERESSGL